MAYYDALVAKWATLTPGTTAAKLAQINALTITAGAQKCLLEPNTIVNAIVPADLLGLTTNQLLTLQLLLFGRSTIDASPGTTVRAVFQSIFGGKAATLANLTGLVAAFDAPAIPWWQATVAQGGGGLNGPVGTSDLSAAGGLV